MNPSLMSDFFQPTYMVIVALLMFLVFVLVFIPSMMVPSAKPEAVGKAIACYLMKTFGLVLMAIGFLPLLYTVISKNMLDMSAVSGLLLIFLIGFGLLLHYSIVAHAIDDSSTVVMRAIFSHGFEVLGAMIAVFSALSLMLSFLQKQAMDGWQIPATMLLFGLLTMLMFSVHISNKNGGVKSRKKK